jgi:hypothetical protein
VCDQNVKSHADQFISERVELIVASLGPSGVNYDVLTFHVAEVAKTCLERLKSLGVTDSSSSTQKSDLRDPCLLRARYERPRCSSATDKCDEFPSPHGFARAEDTIGYQKNITFLDRELSFGIPKRPAPMSAFGSKADIAISGVHVCF